MTDDEVIAIDVHSWKPALTARVIRLHELGLGVAGISNAIGRKKGIKSVRRHIERLGLERYSEEEQAAKIGVALRDGKFTSREVKSIMYRANMSMKVAWESAAMKRDAAAKRSPARVGQALFRSQVLRNYNGTCVISGSRQEEVVQAAHIIPFAVLPRHDVTNALALRADLHALYDLGLIAIDPTDMVVRVSVSVIDDEYSRYNGRRIEFGQVEHPPDRSCLRWHMTNRFARSQ